MRHVSALEASGTTRSGIAALAALLAAALGVSALFYPRPYFPLVVGGIIVATAVLIAWFYKPVWALYAALFVILLPIGLIPPDIHSTLNRAVTAVAVVVGLLDLLVHRHRIQWTGSTLLMAGFVTWSAVTLLWAHNLSRAIIMLQTYVLRLALFLFLISIEIRTREKLDGLLRTLALSGWVLMAVGAWVIVSQGYESGTRLKVLLMNENSTGILAVVMMIGVLWRTIQASSGRKWLRNLTASIFMLGTIALAAASGSRGSAISLLATLLAFCFWKPTRSWGLLSLLAIALGVVLAPLLFVTILERFAVVPGDTLLGGREALWQASWRLILDYPWSGVGLGNAPYAVMPYVQPLRSVMGLDKAVVHNPVLTIWSETGIPGVLLYLGILGSALWSFTKHYLQHRKAGAGYFTAYYALVSSAFLGYMLSWIKGGGMESDHTYFLMLALLHVPACLDADGLEAR